MGDVIHLPPRHHQHPRCPHCQNELPTFNDVTMFMTQDVQLLGVTFHVRCRCGKSLNLTKTVKH